MTLGDWRSLPAETTAQLYRRERIRWQRRLSWETTLTWATIEAARVTWGLPGLVCSSPQGTIEGWAFYLVRHDRVDVGGLVAETAEATMALVTGLAERARDHAGLAGFIYGRAPGLDAALAAHGVATRPYLYLARPLATLQPGSTAAAVLAPRPGLDTHQEPVAMGCWHDRHTDHAARVLSEAYGSHGRLFAPHDEPREWQEYVASLISQTGCGVLSPALSRVVTHGETLCALAMVTELSRRTAHLAQIAVAPSWRRHGVAQALMTDVLSAAQHAGYDQMSLLVSSANQPACALYRRLGFVERARFLALNDSRQ